MYIVHFFNQASYEFCMSLHSTRAAAEIAAGEMLQRFGINQRSGLDFRGEAVSLEPLPPKEKWDELFDCCGEGVHLYRIELDGEPAEKINLSSEDLASA
jgi:hypothetical protein